MQHFMKILLVALLGLGIVSCSSDSNNAIVPDNKTLVVKTLTDIVPDTTVGYYLFSFDQEKEVQPSAVGGSAWDLRLNSMQNLGNNTQRRLDILLNSGTVNPNGKTKGVLVDVAFDNLDVAPADSLFRNDDIADDKRIILPSAFLGTGIFNYNVQTHTLVANPQKTLVVKTVTGKYVKIQFVRLYPMAVTTPDRNTPLGYYTIRYLIGEGTRLK